MSNPRHRRASIVALRHAVRLAVHPLAPQQPRLTLRSFGMPIAAYLAWTRAIHWFFPGFVNTLVFWPIMNWHDVSFPTDATLWSAALSLRADEWPGCS